MIMDQLKHDTILAIAIAIGVWCKKGEMEKMAEGINWLASILTKEDLIDTKDLIERMKDQAPGVEYKEYIKMHFSCTNPKHAGVVDPFREDFE